MANTIFKKNQIVVLLGAGASVEAGIPDAAAMVDQVEAAVVGSDDKWNRFRQLYWYIRSAVYYADGIDGTFGDKVLFNIERLVNALDELRKKERHTLYPFVGAWNPKLLDVAGSDFENVRTFRSAIVQMLRSEWVVLPDEDRAEYFQGLMRFQNEYNYPLRVFTLNYDLCVEKACSAVRVQRGFENRRWDWRLFDETGDGNAPILLYKLHGSTDWQITADGKVTFSDAPTTIPEDDVAMIFGTAYKLQYVDPFLFLAYELRRWTLDDARVLVCIGYGFGDEHINGILGQALRQSGERKLLSVIGPGGESDEDLFRKRVCDLLQAQDGQVEVRAVGARRFLDDVFTIEFLASLFPQEEELIEELPGPTSGTT